MANKEEEKKKKAKLPCRICRQIFPSSIGRSNHERTCFGPCPRCSVQVKSGGLQAHFVTCQPEIASERRLYAAGLNDVVKKRERQKQQWKMRTWCPKCRRWWPAEDFVDHLSTCPLPQEKKEEGALTRPRNKLSQLKEESDEKRQKKRKRELLTPTTARVMEQKDKEEKKQREEPPQPLAQTRVMEGAQPDDVWSCPFCPLPPFPRYCLLGMHLQLAHAGEPTAYAMWVKAWAPGACCDKYNLPCCAWCDAMRGENDPPAWALMDSLINGSYKRDDEEEKERPVKKQRLVEKSASEDV
jgi:hypothetical protein